ncbi:hypothetical protein DL96DRAFT_353311 [Flagelloscypha sp. PMI_526]|nr:hypothetical protein DL96DRAFT_353311 [Flagelloscypha sp. PMI_526]
MVHWPSIFQQLTLAALVLRHYSNTRPKSQLCVDLSNVKGYLSNVSPLPLAPLAMKGCCLVFFSSFNPALGLLAMPHGSFFPNCSHRHCS